MDFLLKLIDQMSGAGILVSITAFIVGIKFPDWDFKMGLKHRNILTHSPLILLLLLKLYEGDGSSTFRYFIMGFTLALGVHFIFDIFPKGWSGGALLKVPIFKISLKPSISKGLFLIFIVYTLFEVVYFTESVVEFFYLFILGLICFLQNVKKEEKFFRPFLMFACIFIIFGAFRYEVIYKTIESSSKNVIKITKTYYYELKK
ncbi:hypothetical protein [Cetobacterium sp. SF1]|uniref:hypothetical protein n=1 Tax=unclassified Cetobacterium TaxID=2630983 RepID=UPI003CF8CBAD